MRPVANQAVDNRLRELRSIAPYSVFTTAFTGHYFYVFSILKDGNKTFVFG
jgi:hypothetical protein